MECVMMVKVTQSRQSSWHWQMTDTVSPSQWQVGITPVTQTVSYRATDPDASDPDNYKNINYLIINDFDTFHFETPQVFHDVVGVKIGTVGVMEPILDIDTEEWSQTKPLDDKMMWLCCCALNIKTRTEPSKYNLSQCLEHDSYPCCVHIQTNGLVAFLTFYYGSWNKVTWTLGNNHLIFWKLLWKETFTIHHTLLIEVSMMINDDDDGPTKHNVWRCVYRWQVYRWCTGRVHHDGVHCGACWTRSQSCSAGRRVHISDTHQTQHSESFMHHLCH